MIRLIRSDCRVLVTLHGASPEYETKTLPAHKKNPDLGAKVQIYGSPILIEQTDALSFEDNEEVCDCSVLVFERVEIEIEASTR